MPNGLPITPEFLVIKPITSITIWGIHGGQFAEVEDMFLKENMIALGWSEIGNLNEYPSRERLFRALSRKFRGNTIPSIRMNTKVPGSNFDERASTMTPRCFAWIQLVGPASVPSSLSIPCTL